MAKCALVGAVDFNAPHFLRQEFDCVIAVDAGYRHLQALGIDPDCVIGDFDSLGYVPQHPHLIRFPTQKDESDIELALEEAVSQGFDELFVYGCLGGRLDFTYAVYQLIVRFAEEGKSIFGIGIDCAVTALVGGLGNAVSFSEEAKGTLSLFAVSRSVTGVDETGLAYSLNQATMQNDKPLGVSNEFCGVPSRVSVKEGTALLFFSAEAWEALR